MALNRLRGEVIRKVRSAAEAEESRAIIEELRAITDRQRVRIGDLERELARVSPQVAALEARLESLRDTVERGNVAAGAAVGGNVDTASIWAEIQRQQEQVRARITAAMRFEERLRRLEDGNRVG
jgi:predicted  nucleic acid-binding Zn-ribbon protein